MGGKPLKRHLYQALISQELLDAFAVISIYRLSQQMHVSAQGAQLLSVTSVK